MRVGVIVSRDQLDPSRHWSPFQVVRSERGTTSDCHGYFSLLKPRHHYFLPLGMKPNFLVRDSLQTGRYSLIQAMYRDTVGIGHC